MIEKDILESRYFKWLLKKSWLPNKYKNLYKKMQDIKFIVVINMDDNRAKDGIDLRYRYGYENNISESIITKYIDTKECSFLEMIVALSIRCEEHIMTNPDIGDRTSYWIKLMLISSGLDVFTDDNYNDDKVTNIIENILYRKYSCDGKGGLFYIKNSEYDLRKVDIWYQMCWYMEIFLEKGE